jgi:hypothetical protein
VPPTAPSVPLQVRRRLALALAGAAVFGCSLLLGRSPELAELYARTLGRGAPFLLSHVTGWLPLSLAEILVAAFVLRQLVGAAGGIRGAVRKQRRWRNALAAGGLRLAQDVGVAVALFYLLWGWNYARAPLEERLGWQSGESAGVDEVATLCRQMVEATNGAYLALHGVEDAGKPTARPQDRAALDDAIEEGWRVVGEELALAEASGPRRGRPKRLLASPLLDRLGLTGFYFPFTGEANLNGGIPAISLPQVLAHEKAHQRGIAPEDEANFLGFLVAARAPHPLARYSAHLFAHRQLLGALIPSDRERAKELLEARLPGVQRDVDDLYAYWQRFRGPMQRAANVVNDAYLRTNRVEGGITSYSRSVELLLAYERTRGAQ